MLYEIDFLPVGEGESSGDAICLRYSLDKGNSWYIGVIDGGTQEAGKSLCNHIRKYYGTDEVDFVVCSHPDQDHASGLAEVLENLVVKQVMMHCPWEYVDFIYDRVSDGRATKESVRKRLMEGHPYAYHVYELATKKNIPIYPAFSDSQEHQIPCLTIAGPSFQFYLDQLVNFRSITEITEETQAEFGLLGALKKVTKWAVETWDKEKLVDPEDNATSSENNSSTILLFDFDGNKKMLTADAGVPALEQAADYLKNNGIPLQGFSLFQAPHHGSKRNIGPSTLDRLIAPPVPQGSSTKFTAMISASKEGNPKHPNKRVVNALCRRGGKVLATQGSSVRYFAPGMPDRDGWARAKPLPFYTEVEDDDD